MQAFGSVHFVRAWGVHILIPVLYQYHCSSTNSFRISMHGTTWVAKAVQQDCFSSNTSTEYKHSVGIQAVPFELSSLLALLYKKKKKICKPSYTSTMLLHHFYNWKIPQYDHGIKITTYLVLPRCWWIQARRPAPSYPNLLASTDCRGPSVLLLN